MANQFSTLTQFLRGRQYQQENDSIRYLVFAWYIDMIRYQRILALPFPFPRRIEISVKCWKTIDNTTASLMAQMFQVHINTSWQDTATVGGGRSSVPTNEEGLHDGLSCYAAGIAAFQLWHQHLNFSVILKHKPAGQTVSMSGFQWWVELYLYYYQQSPLGQE